MWIWERIIRVVLVGVALTTAIFCPACDGAAPQANWTEIDPLMGRGDVEKVRGGFTFTEGPVWIASKGLLLFSDIPADTIHQLQPPATVTVFRMPSGKSNGLGVPSLSPRPPPTARLVGPIGRRSTSRPRRRSIASR